MPKSLDEELFNAIDHYLHTAVDPLHERLSKLEMRVAVEALARDILRERGGKVPPRDQLDEVISRHLRGFSVVQPEPPLVLDGLGPWTLRTPDGRTVPLGGGVDERSWLTNPR